MNNKDLTYLLTYLLMLVHMHLCMFVHCIWIKVACFDNEGDEATKYNFCLPLTVTGWAGCDGRKFGWTGSASGHAGFSLFLFISLSLSLLVWGILGLIFGRTENHNNNNASVFILRRMYRLLPTTPPSPSRHYYPRLIDGTNLPTPKGWIAWLANADCMHITFAQGYYTIESKGTRRKWT